MTRATRRGLLIGLVAVPVAAGVVVRERLGRGRLPSATGAPDAPEVRPEGFTRAAVQEAVDAAVAAGGGVVRLDVGTYLLDGPLLLGDRVALVGRGPRSVVKAGPDFLTRRGPHGGHPLISTEGTTDVTVSRLTADHSGDLLDVPEGRRLREYLVDGRHCENLVVQDVTTRNPFTYSIAVVGSTRFAVRGCRTRTTTSGRWNQLDGIHVLGSSQGEVVGNDVDQGVGSDGDDGLVAHTISQACHDVVFRENRVRGGVHGAAMQLAVGDAPLSEIVVQSNYFYGSRRGLRSGRWGDGDLRDITIGGSSRGNVFVGNGSAVDLREVPAAGVVVLHNSSIDSGDFTGRDGVVVRDNSVRGGSPAVAGGDRSDRQDG